MTINFRDMASWYYLLDRYIVFSSILRISPFDNQLRRKACEILHILGDACITAECRYYTQFSDLLTDELSGEVIDLSLDDRMAEVQCRLAEFAREVPEVHQEWYQISGSPHSDVREKFGQLAREIEQLEKTAETGSDADISLSCKCIISLIDGLLRVQDHLAVFACGLQHELEGMKEHVQGIRGRFDEDEDEES